MSSQRRLLRGSARSGKYPSRKCPSEKCQPGICSWGSVSWGTVRVPIYQWNFLRGTSLKSSKKEQWPALFVENPVKSLFSLSKATTDGFAFFKGKYCQTYQYDLLKIAAIKRFIRRAMTSSDRRAPSKKPSSIKTAREMQFLKESKVLLKFVK